MLKRIITAIWAILLFIPICYFSEYGVYSVAMSLLAMVAVYELAKCVKMSNRYVFMGISYLFALIAPLMPFVLREHGDMFAVIFMSATIYTILVMAFLVFSASKVKYQNTAALYTGVMYITIMFTCMATLRYIENGKLIYLLAFLGAWGSDTFAYFGGTLFGKHKLIPEVSPKKTVEGSVVGIVFTAVIFVVYGIIVWKVYGLDAMPNPVILAIMGALCSVVSQIGDLAASVIKRNYDVKDYGNIFPGHGGVLDRFDSVLMTAPIILLITLVSPISLF